ncbi:hypothetical protein GQ43DRAFT_440741 [Delitschia confertaspora ATCC 74209]|uniref:Uncharacterized protein n=1 Tax=Delitschia confertaspora ATCC 74209 TaxID=1513339 RepID=A0A9P4JRI0_9PLEO|nr:hypothetical protein GQ43DRAFT_440741 [Delitschia confertaspora ATCC 74209]
MANRQTSFLSTRAASSSSFAPAATPSGLTPNTRSEAEAALSLNAFQQTESAAPTTPLPHTDSLDVDAKLTFRRDAPVVGFDSSSALAAAHQDSSISSNLSTDTTTSNPSQIAGIPIPPPGQGVVPLHTGVGSGQADAVKKARPHGLSLGDLGRQQSWDKNDYKHVYSAGLMGKVDGDAGYSSNSREKED